ncbi:MAG: YihY/virulence factor BrkB family protein [Dehalococcoidales bacterium]|nr:YihY/virulence factor BrkB family protein [Dehalococcoidales bacterium]
MGKNIKRMKTGLVRVKNRLLTIPAVQLIVRTADGAGKHDASQRAAGVAYYVFLSIFPLLLGLIALFGYFLPSLDLQETMLNFVGENVPGAVNIIEQNITGIIESRGSMGLLSIVIFIWGASAMFGALSLAINRAWEVPRYRPFFIRKGSELGMVFGIGIIVLLSISSSAVISILHGVFHLPVTGLLIVNICSKVLGFLLMVIVFVILYKYLPYTKTHWRTIWPGALLASILFEIARTLFIYYIENFASYQLIYGSIASIIVLLVWIYYSSFVTVLGAEFTFQYGRMRYSVTTDNGADNKRG